MRKVWHWELPGYVFDGYTVHNRVGLGVGLMGTRFIMQWVCGKEGDSS